MQERLITIVGLVAGLSAAWVAAPVAVAPARASFPGRNGKIAFARDEGRGGPAVDLMNADGGVPKRLTKSGADAPAPSWSADGSNPQPLTDENGVIDRHPSWKPLTR